MNRRERKAWQTRRRKNASASTSGGANIWRACRKKNRRMTRMNTKPAKRLPTVATESRPDTSLPPDRVEQGIAVWEVSDYEDIAAATEQEAVAFAVKEWGYDSPEQAAKNDAYEPKDVFAVKLDERKVNINEDEDPAGPILTYREHLKALIATGQKFPMFFAGRE